MRAALQALVSVKLPIRREAVVELDDAMTFYDEEREGLGLELLQAVEETVEFAFHNPDAGERRAAGSGHELRRFVVKRFPYLVYVAGTAERREIVAIAHGSRRPRYWDGRVK